jgi:RecB family endonuclease NucS
MSLPRELRSEIVTFIQQGLSNDQISERLKVRANTVRAVKAWLSRTHDPGAEVDEVVDAIETTFGLERDLQMALRSNIEQLERGLRITDGGKERTVESGRIDITASGKDGATVAIELKVGSAGRETIGQILGYMGDLQNSKVPIRGIIVAGDFDRAAVAAARAARSIKLKKYRFKFLFESIE